MNDDRFGLHADLECCYDPVRRSGCGHQGDFLQTDAEVCQVVNTLDGSLFIKAEAIS